MSPTQSVICCEGFHDRAFWAGLLVVFGCTSARRPGAKHVVRDPWGTRVDGGHFGFWGRGDFFIRLSPAKQTGSSPLDMGRHLITQVETRSLTRLIVCRDTDSQEFGTTTERVRESADALLAPIRGASGTVVGADLLVEFRGKQTVVNFVDWGSKMPQSRGVPALNTLERLVCAAIAASHPNRASAVAEWLHALPDPPPGSPKVDAKSHAASYMAGWYPLWGSEGFFEAIWDDPTVRSQLLAQLESAGTAEVVRRLAAGL